MIKKSLLVLISTISLINLFSTEIQAKEYEKVSIERKTEDCKKNISDNKVCLEISIEYPKILGAFKNSKIVDDFIRNNIIGLLSNYSENKVPKDETIENAIKKSFEDFKKETAEYVNPYWSYSSTSKVLYQSPKYISVVVNNYSYTGGAHGNGSSQYATFNINNGKKVLFENIVKNKKLLLNIAEKKFRKDQGLAPNQSFQDAGFWFKDNKFYLPDNFAITKEGVLFQYGLYEIAPYSAGMIELVIKNNEYKFSYSK